MKLPGSLWLLTLIPIAHAVTIQEVPLCAQNCLANSTQAQTTCQVIDISCLCSNTAYVSTLSCCLATTCSAEEQSIAIQFNQEECSKVGKQAPAFVGCSPLNLTALQSGASPSATTLQTQTSTSNSLVLTISGNVVTEPPSFSGPTNTATFGGAPLLTGTCSNPYFAIVTNSAGLSWEFPAVGCGPGRQNCCPFAYGSNAKISRCPQDYFTTSGGCCPVGYQIYYTGIGPQIPCYSVPSSTFWPASTPTETARLTLITQTVFAQRFELVEEKSTGKLTGGALIGVIVGPIAAAVLITNIILVCMWRRRKVKKREDELNRPTTYPPIEPSMSLSEVSQTPQELASPDMVRAPRSAPLGIVNWINSPTSSPPAYDSQRNAAMIGTNKLRIPQDPQELEGSTFINQHHPAFGTDSTSASETPKTTTSPSAERPKTPKTPKTPVRSPPGSERESPLITPSSGIGASPRTPSAVSPPNSPRQLPGRMV